jgi:hypothetical protein
VEYLNAKFRRVFAGGTAYKFGAKVVDRLSKISGGCPASAQLVDSVTALGDGTRCLFDRTLDPLFGVFRAGGKHF